MALGEPLAASQDTQALEVEVPTGGGVAQCVGNHTEVIYCVDEVGDASLHCHDLRTVDERHVIEVKGAPAVADADALALSADAGDELVSEGPELPMPWGSAADSPATTTPPAALARRSSPRGLGSVLSQAA